MGAGSVALWVIPPPGVHASVVHGLPSSRGVAVPPLQAPALHCSFTVHGLPSSQVPVWFGFEHVPVPGLHVPTSWH